LVKAVQTGLVQTEERIVILATGSGLKDIPAAMQTVGKPKRIQASLKAVQAALDDDLFIRKR